MLDGQGSGWRGGSWRKASRSMSSSLRAYRWIGAYASQIAAASEASFFCRRNVGLHISRRHYASLVAERHQLARPIMRRPAGFKPDKARGQRSKKLQQLVAPEASMP